MMSKLDMRNNLRNSLWPKQRVLLDRISKSLSVGEPVHICAGQRSGKTHMMNVLAFDHEHVMFTVGLGGSTASMAHLRYSTEIARELHPNVVALHAAERFFDLAVHTVTPETLVIMDEAYWWSSVVNTAAFYEKLREHTNKIVVIGSRGPQMFGDPWCFATWELNPHIVKEHLKDQYDKDPVRAKRDFEG